MKATNRKLEETITRLKKDLMQKEDENEELTNTLEMLRSWCEQPKELAQRNLFRKLNYYKVLKIRFLKFRNEREPSSTYGRYFKLQ